MAPEIYHCMAFKSNGEPCRSCTGAGPVRAGGKVRWLCAAHRKLPELLKRFQGFLQPAGSEPVWEEDRVE